MERRNNNFTTLLQKMSDAGYTLQELIDFLETYEELQDNQTILKEYENLQSKQTASKPQEVDIELKVTEMIRELNIPAHIRGYSYLRYAITQVYYTNDMRATKSIYPEVAKKFNTTSSRAARAIRHAIEKSFNNSTPDILEKYFSYSVSLDKGKPTNTQFIATLADNLRLRYPL